MTTPTWEPVGQEVLERVVEKYKGHEFLSLPQYREYSTSAELLAARALLRALVEADIIDSCCEDHPAIVAIRAHVQRVQDRSAT